MSRNRVLGMVALVCAAALGAGVAFAGGGHDCGGKSDAHAKGAKMECNMTAEQCAQEMQKSLSTRGWLGISFDDSGEDAVTISKVYPGSPAEQAGFQVGDRIVSINGVELGEKNEEKVHGMLKKAKIGDQVSYVVARDSQDVTLTANLTQIPQGVLSEMTERHLHAEHATAKN